MLLAAGNGTPPAGSHQRRRGPAVRHHEGHPLSRAAHNGHFQTCKFLLEQGAEVDAMDLGDNTPLHWASMRGHVEIVNLLLMHGADRSQKQAGEDADRSVPADLEQRGGHEGGAVAVSGRVSGRSDVVFFIPSPSLSVVEVYIPVSNPWM